MPEIVELRSDADALDFYITNRELLSVNFCTDLFNNHCKGIEELNQELPLKILNVYSRAKKLFIKLENNWWIYITYGMSGRISTEKRKHSHLEFNMSESWIGFNTWYYENARRIGNIEASNSDEVFNHQVSDMGKPFVLGYSEDDFSIITKEEYIENIKNCNTFLVKALMDQRSIGSGIGNYLLSEIMYDAELDPDIKCKDLSDNEINNLWNSIHKIIMNSYYEGGVSMKDYMHIDGSEGSFEEKLKVYNKDGQKDANGNTIKVKKGKHGRNIWYT